MTTGRGGRHAGADGGLARHVPVLLSEAVAALSLRVGGRYLDGTFGAGGYARAILAAPGVRLLALDRDPNAIRDGQAMVAEAAGRLVLAQARFGELDLVAEREGFAPLDGVVLDIGVSSMQIDEAERGFSFRREGPLDMRMGGEGPSAADIVNTESFERIADILRFYGEEKRTGAIARAIVAARDEEPILTTSRLQRIVASVSRPARDGIDPATRTFQALRIAVNDELGELVRALHAAERVLAEGGRLAVVTFHSLEDRIVKRFLSLRAGRMGGGSRHLPAATGPEPTFRLVGSQPVEPSDDEVAANPRARSAKLRVAERTAAPVPGPCEEVMALAALPVRRPAGRRGR
jgi:16S rRNA (cytosine1402-N4)-methyltransferase